MRKFRGGWLAAALALAVSGVVAAAKPPGQLEKVIAMRVDGEVAIDAEGQVIEVTVASRTPPAIQAMIEQGMRRWRFKPLLVDGVAQPARSQMRLTLVATPRTDAEGYLVRVDNAIFPGEIDDESAPRNHRGVEADTPTAHIKVLSMVPPNYPLQMQMYGVSGKVLLGLKLGMDGRVETVQVVQSMLLGARGHDRALEAALRDFELAASGRAKAWTYEITPTAERVAPADLTVLVPVVFLMEGDVDEPPGSWQTVVRTPKRPIGWLPATEGVYGAGVADLASGESLPARSRLVLAEDVLGAKL